MNYQPASYHHLGRRVALSRNAAIGYAWARLLNDPDGQVNLQDETGTIRLQVRRPVMRKSRYGTRQTRYRVLRGETCWSGWTRIPQAAYGLAPDLSEIDTWELV